MLATVEAVTSAVPSWPALRCSGLWLAVLIPREHMGRLAPRAHVREVRTTLSNRAVRTGDPIFSLRSGRRRLGDPIGGRLLGLAPEVQPPVQHREHEQDGAEQDQQD